MPHSQLYIESRKMPFVRLLLALIIGIVLQWYLDIQPVVSLLLFAIALLTYSVFFFLPAYQRFRGQWLQGVVILTMIATTGSLLSFIKNPLHQKDNYTQVYKEGDAIVATVDETLITKPKTFKANVAVNGVYHNKVYTPVSGIIIVYFDKENIAANLDYGSQILFTKPIQDIKNTGNPGSFDYRRFLLFQGITGQANLKKNEYTILPHTETSNLQLFLNGGRHYVLQTIQTYIPGKNEQSVAEALLIGYRNDLDKQLVQSYSKTGVVHIIAISGLHLGMIYGFILLLFSRFKNKKWYRFVVPIVALAVLWLFTLLAGAVPSILRSAVTFSFIAAGMFIGRKTNIYNTLAASAFCLLVYHPYYLWDVGFQLSYTAVLGIVLFSKPIANCLYLQNRIANAVWQMMCITLSAQILTLPVILYNFHQFPVLFLFTNLLIVPLSELILFALLFLILIGKLTSLAVIAGKATGSILWLMNEVIIRTAALPFSTWSYLKTDTVQVWLLYLIIILLAVWLLYQLPRLLLYSLMLLIVLLVYTSIDVIQASQQKELIVYNIDKHHAIDILNGRQALCFYDDSLPEDITANSFYINPSHTMHRVRDGSYHSLSSAGNLEMHVNDKTFLIISKPLPRIDIKQKMKADAVILTNNARLYIGDVVKSIDCPLIIADNGTSQWKLAKWKQDCNSLGIRFHSISQNGAFIADI